MLTGTDPLGRRDGRSGMPPYLNRPRAQTRRHLVGFVVQRGCVIGSKGSDQKHRNTCRHSRAQSVLIKEGTPQPPRTTPSTPRHWWMVQSFLDIYELQRQGKTRNGSVMLEREDCGSTSPPKKKRTHTHTHTHTHTATPPHTHTHSTHTTSAQPFPRLPALESSDNTRKITESVPFMRRETLQSKGRSVCFAKGCVLVARRHAVETQKTSVSHRCVQETVKCAHAVGGSFLHHGWGLFAKRAD